MAPSNALNQNEQFQEELSSTDDNVIIRRVLEGEKELYALLIRKYNQRLYRVGLSIINKGPEVEDTMQKTYIHAYENLGKFRFESSFSTWLTKIMVNESLRHKKKRELNASRERSGLALELDKSAVETQTPLKAMLNSELKTILETAIRGLPEKYRIVFIVREMENMNVAETMECLGLGEANVKIRLHRAKIMLRDKLKEYLKEEDLLQLYQSHCDRMVDSVMAKIIKEDKKEA